MLKGTPQPTSSLLSEGTTGSSHPAATTSSAAEMEATTFISGRAPIEPLEGGAPTSSRGATDPTSSIWEGVATTLAVPKGVRVPTDFSEDPGTYSLQGGTGDDVFHGGHGHDQLWNGPRDRGDDSYFGVPGVDLVLWFVSGNARGNG